MKGERVPTNILFRSFKAVTLCLRRPQETPAQLQKLVVGVQLASALCGSCLIADLKASKADWSVKFDRKDAPKKYLDVQDCTNNNNPRTKTLPL